MLGGLSLVQLVNLHHTEPTQPVAMVEVYSMPVYTAGETRASNLDPNPLRYDLSAGVSREIEFFIIPTETRLSAGVAYAETHPSIIPKPKPKPQPKSMVQATQSVEPKTEKKSDYKTLKVDPSSLPKSDMVMSYELASLTAVIHLEAGEGSDISSKCAVGNVVSNRVKDVGKWGYSNYTEALYAPRQFTVVNSGKFIKLRDELLSQGATNSDVTNSLKAAESVMSGASYLPADVQFFHGDENKRSWGNHTYYTSIGGNSFFIK